MQPLRDCPVRYMHRSPITIPGFIILGFTSVPAGSRNSYHGPPCLIFLVYILLEVCRGAERGFTRLGWRKPATTTILLCNTTKTLGSHAMYYVGTILTPLYRKGRAGVLIFCSFLRVPCAGDELGHPRISIAEFMFEQLINANVYEFSN